MINVMRLIGELLLRVNGGKDDGVRRLLQEGTDTYVSYQGVRIVE